jgi:hypothetical protein
MSTTENEVQQEQTLGDFHDFQQALQIDFYESTDAVMSKHAAAGNASGASLMDVMFCFGSVMASVVYATVVDKHLEAITDEEKVIFDAMLKGFTEGYQAKLEVLGNPAALASFQKVGETQDGAVIVAGNFEHKQTENKSL